MRLYLHKSINRFAGIKLAGMVLTLSKGVCLQYYKRKDVQEAMVAEAREREVGVCFGQHQFGKRPDVLLHPKDVLELVKRGVTSFHCSEERWTNPLTLGPDLKTHELNDLRAGWDLILDIDCKELEYSRIAAKLVVDALHHHDLKCVSVKFSGNHGFHIGVPFEAFPQEVNGTPTRLLFPEGPRKIAKYLQHMIHELLAEQLIGAAPLSVLAQRTGKKVSELMKNGRFDPFSIVNIDTVLIASRHLYRMPYSFNEKSGLVSIPVDPRRIADFDVTDARHENVVVNAQFMAVKIVENDTRKLFMQAFDFNPPEEAQGEKAPGKEFVASEIAVPAGFFPPCIQRIHQPLDDGKKRALFILVNFLQSCGWSADQINEYVHAWNAAQPEPLREVYLKGQLRYVRTDKRVKLPPNCANAGYYQDLQLCHPDNFCRRIKNPANYAILKHKSSEENAPKKKLSKKRADRGKKKDVEVPAAQDSTEQQNGDTAPEQARQTGARAEHE